MRYSPERHVFFFLCVILPNHLAMAQNPPNAENETLTRAAIQGYLNNRESFPFLRCRYTETVANAYSFEDCLAGKFTNAVVSSRLLLIDGKKIFHREEFDQKRVSGGTWTSTRRLDNGAIMTTTPSSSSGYLADGKLRFRYSPAMQAANVITPETSFTGICVTLLNLGDPSEVFAFGPDYLLRESDAGKYRFWPEGNQTIDGKLMIKAGFGNASGQRMQDWYFDPEKGFLPYRIIIYDVKQDRVYGQLCLVRARKLSNNRWFPEQSVNITLPRRTDGPFSVRETKVVELDVDHRPDRSEFTLEVPAGTQVVDPAHRQFAFRLRQQEKVNVDDISTLAEMCSHAMVRPMDTTLPRRRSYFWLNWVGLSALTVLAVWFGFQIYRRLKLRLTRSP